MTRLITILAIAALAGSVLTACAARDARDAELLEMYQAHAGEPVGRVQFIRLTGWRPLGNEWLLLQSRDRRYLVGRYGAVPFVDEKLLIEALRPRFTQEHPGQEKLF
jgi:hypothetical protein